MTKLKNTKKGMAKKALSISLVAAMLATSNVPVWAAEDLFSDGSAAVEAPAVVEEPAAEVQAFSAEPVEETADAVQTQATVSSDDYTVDLGNKDTDGTFANLVKNGVTWGESKEYNFKIKESAEIPQYWTIKYAWLCNGTAIGETVEWNTAPTEVGGDGQFNDKIALNLNSDEYAQYAGKTINLYVQIVNGSGNVAWTYTSDAVKVNAKTLEGVSISVDNKNLTYNGTEQKQAINVSDTNGKLNKEDFTLDYDGDLVNVGEVTVKATVNKTGYTGTLETSYNITPLNLSDTSVKITDYIEASFKNTSMPYTGKESYEIYASDITLKDKKTGADVSYLLDDEDAVATISAKTVGAKDLQADIIINGTQSEKKNFYTTATDGEKVTTSNKMTIVARDLSTVTATMKGNIKYDGEAVTETDLTTVGITYKDANGKELTLDKDVKITVPSNAKDVGTYTATIEANSKNVTKSTTVKFSIYQMDISGARFANYLDTTSLSDEIYTGKQITKDVSSFGKVMLGDTVLTSSDYEIQYGTNVDVGEGYLYIVGKGNYAGTKATYKFTIKPAIVDELSAAKTVEYIPGAEVADYKEAFALKVTASNGKVALVEGDDYTVEYKFVNSDGGAVDASDVKVGDYVQATITLKDKKNFDILDSYEYSIEVPITYTQLKDSDIVMNQTSYEYTGETIEPDFDLVVNGRTISPDNYTVSISNGTDAGTASFTVTAVKGSQAIAGSAKGTFTITPADMSKVDVVIPSQPYSGYSVIPTADKFEVTFNGKEYTKEAAKKFIESNFKLSYGENIDMGEKAGTVTLTPKTTNKNFTGTKTVTFTIAGKFIEGENTSLNFYDENGLLINDFAFEKSEGTWKGNENNGYLETHPDAFEYSGKELSAAKTIYTNGDMDLTEGTDYEIIYVDNVSGKKLFEGYWDGVGEEEPAYGQYGAVLVVAKGQYAGNYESKGTVDEKGALAVKDGIYTCADGTKISNVAYAEFFRIGQLWIQAKNISVSNGTYAAGFQVKPEVTITVDGVVLTEGKDYKLHYNESQDRVNATSSKSLEVGIEGINGYAGGGDFYWGIDKFDLANATISYSSTGVSLKCGKVDIDPSEFTVSVDGSKVTVTAAKDSKNYTGSKTIDIELEDEKPAAPVIQAVKVSGNNATVVLAGEADGAEGYDYVISTDRNCITTKDYDGVNKNKLATETTFAYVEQGTYYAYCHSWKRVDGVKVFSDWSAAYPFSVSAITPDQPVIVKTEKSTNGKHLRVTWTKSANATGYDIVMGTKVVKNTYDEYRPTDYGKAVKKITNGNTVSVIFYNIPKGTYYVGLHAYNRTSETGTKVFSKWSNYEKLTF